MGLFVVLLTACHHHDDNVPEPDYEHTLLIYISGDNSLSSLADQNILACEEGLLNSINPLNLVIYKDNYGKSGKSGYAPTLFQLRANSKKHSIDTVYLKNWINDLDSSNPDHFAEVVSMVFKKSDSNVKGLEMWGHGRSWIPGHTWNPNATGRASQFACIDSLNYMEVWEMHDALDNTGIHFDYILFDACFMGTAEVAYELRNNCNWMVGSPCEIPDKGYPYTQFIGNLSNVTGNTEEKDFLLKQALKDCISSYGQRYPDRGALSLIDESAIEALHSAYNVLLVEYEAFYAEMASSPYKTESKMQHYGRTATGDRYHFYDLADFAHISGGSLDLEIQQAVPFFYSATQYADGAGTVSFENSCGMAITPPQLFSISGLRESLVAAYPLLEWSKQ